MPKELTHWWLAAEAVQQLPLDRTIRQLLEEHQSAYLVGSVLPDTLLHLVRGPWSATALKLVQSFHEPPGNSFTPLLRYLEQHSPLSPAATACLLGVAAHMEADIAFHPYICALSGDDLGRHYQIETELDLYLLHTGRQPPAWRLQELLRKEVVEVAVSVLEGVFDPQSHLPRAVVQQTLHLHSRIQGMYGSPYWQLTARLLGMLPLPSLKRWQKLFYPLHWRKGQVRQWPARWRHRVTGQERGDTPDGLIVEACNRITGLLRKADEQGLVRCFREQIGRAHV